MNNYKPTNSLSHWILLLFSFMSMMLLLPKCNYQEPAVEILKSPVSQKANPGSRVELAVKANNATTYSWTKDGQPIVGQSHDTLVFELVKKSNEGVYVCLVGNGQSQSTSTPATLLVNDPPEIIENLSGQIIVNEDEELVISGQVSGTEPLTFRFFCGKRFVGETDKCYWRVEKVNRSDAGQWSFLANNVTGVPIRSDFVEVVVILKPVIAEGEPVAEGEPIVEGEGEGEIIVEGELPSDFCATANNDDDPASPLPMTFSQAFDSLYTKAPRGLLGVFGNLFDYFKPEGDLNGYSWVDKRGSKDELVIYQIGSNGIPDVCEFGLLEKVLNDPNFCLCSSGLSHKLVHKAWQTNMAQLGQDFGDYWTWSEWLIPGLQQVLCGYITIGDGDISYSDDGKYVSGHGSVAIFLGVAYLLGKKLPNPRPDLNKYASFPELFGPYGDADGDGRTNAEEYLAYGPDPDTYALSALNPDVTPP